MIEAKFRKEIQDELTKKLVSKSYRDAVAEKQLRVVSLTNLEDVEFGEDRSMRFRATVVTAPEFDLPEYKNIPVQLPDAKVTEAEDSTRRWNGCANNRPILSMSPDRGLEMEDFAVHRFRGHDRRQADQRSCAGCEQEFAGRKEILAANGRG